MSVVFLSPGGIHGGGGMGTVTRLLTKALQERLPAIPIIVLDPRGDGLVYLFPFYFLWSLLRLVSIHVRHGIDVLHLNVSERLSIPRKAFFLVYGRIFQIPVVLHHHGAEFIPEFHNRSSLYRAIVRWVVQRADLNIVLGQVWADFLICHLGASRDQVVLLYNAVPDPGIDLSLERRGVAERPLTLLMLANLSPRKGVGELLKALRIVIDLGQPVHLILAGGGDVSGYQKMAQELGIKSHCIFTGWVSPQRAQSLLADCDIFVLPSFYEGLPMSILEAFSYGVPVVATPVGSIPEVMTSGRDCLLVPPGDVAALAAALVDLARHSDTRQALGRGGRRLFEQTFNLDAYVDRLLVLYNGMKAQKAKCGAV